MTTADIQLLFAFLASLITLVALIVRFSLSPFIALILSTLVLALMAGLDLSLAWEQFSLGVGAVLSSTAMIIGMGAMIGVLLERSGGAAEISRRLVAVLGVRHIGWTMLIVGLLVGVGVWFTVGLVLLVPIAISLAKVAKVNLLVPAMSMLAGLSAMHGLAPPHPGPLVAVEFLQADIGQTIAWSLVVGSLAAAIAGPLFWRFFQSRIVMPVLDQPFEKQSSEASTGIGAPIAVILAPIVLMLLGSFIANAMESSQPINGSAAGSLRWFGKLFVDLGNPTMAMLVGLVCAYILLGVRAGLNRKMIAELTDKSLYPVANVLLVVAAGAGFSKVLIASGVGDTLAGLAQQLTLPSLLIGWLIAAAFRIATGSATTAITAASGIMSVIVGSDPTVNREFLVLALGAGSLTVSHVNDGGFWFVKEYFGMSVPQTLCTWTVLETVLSIAALAILLVLDVFL